MFRSIQLRLICIALFLLQVTSYSIPTRRQIMTKAAIAASTAVGSSLFPGHSNAMLQNVPSPPPQQVQVVRASAMPLEGRIEHSELLESIKAKINALGDDGDFTSSSFSASMELP
jgi:Spy/CpxP family protein refolding chaperone